jgi:hypothetical protein
LNAIPSAWVPLIELHRRGVEIDLMVALTPFEVIQPNWSLENSDDPLMVGYNLTLLDWWIKTMIVMGMERYLKSIRILNGLGTFKFFKIFHMLFKDIGLHIE